MVQREKLEELFMLIKKIAEEDILVIVEGKRDKKALAFLGVTNVIEVSRTPLYKVIETVSSKYKKCIILTDLDAQGKKLYGKLKSGFSERGIYVDDTLRNRLFKDTTLRQIEGIVTYLKRNEVYLIGIS